MIMSKVKVKVLYWITDKACVLKTQKLENGIIRIKKRSFSVDKSRPYFFFQKSLFGQKVFPIYLLKHNSPYPLVLAPSQKLKYSSENITNLLELKTLDNILKPTETRKADVIMYILIGAVMGALMSAVLFLSKAIPVS